MLFGCKKTEPKTERWLHSNFTIREVWWETGGHATYKASITIGVEYPNGNKRYSEYLAPAESPESALNALKKAVAEGEEGWTW